MAPSQRCLPASILHAELAPTSTSNPPRITRRRGWICMLSFPDSSWLLRLDLKHNTLSGGVPNLPASLQYLSLSANQLTGAVDLTLPRLTRLNFLDLSMNQLDGPIPRVGVRAAGLRAAAAAQLLRGSLQPPADVAILVVDLSYNRFYGQLLPLLAGVRAGAAGAGAGGHRRPAAAIPAAQLPDGHRDIAGIVAPLQRVTLPDVQLHGAAGERAVPDQGRVAKHAAGRPTSAPRGLSRAPPTCVDQRQCQYRCRIASDHRSELVDGSRRRTVKIAKGWWPLILRLNCPVTSVLCPVASVLFCYSALHNVCHG